MLLFLWPAKVQVPGIMIQGLTLDCGELARLFLGLLLMISLLASFSWWACSPLWCFVLCFYGELARHCFPWWARRFVLSFVFSVGFARLFWSRFFKRWPCSLWPTSLKIGWTWTSLVLSRFGQSTQAALIWGKMTRPVTWLISFSSFDTDVIDGSPQIEVSRWC